jgi:hypothetical protein
MPSPQGLTLHMPGLGVLLNTIVHGQLWHEIKLFLFSQTKEKLFSFNALVNYNNCKFFLIGVVHLITMLLSCQKFQNLKTNMLKYINYSTLVCQNCALGELLFVTLVTCFKSVSRNFLLSCHN